MIQVDNVPYPGRTSKAELFMEENNGYNPLETFISKYSESLTFYCLRLA